MISHITGKVLRMPHGSGQLVLLTPGGVGYEITLPASVYQSLVAEGVSEEDLLSLEIYFHTTDRQPRPILVGFRDQSEKQFFEQLVQVEGIGPIRAASALIFPVPAVAEAIENEDLTLLRRMPGIGERAAQKIIATLRGKVLEWATLEAKTNSAQVDSTSESNAKSRDEAIEVLVSLGHRMADARENVDGVLIRYPELSDDREELIREVFRAIARTP